MEKFSDVENNLKPKKYTDPLKERIYNIINNVHVEVNGEKDSDFSITGLEDITEQIFELVNSEKLQEKLNILMEVKGVSNLGGINIKNIDKEIEKIFESLKNK